MKIIAVILASGESSRFGGDKLSARLGDVTILDRTLQIFLDARLAEVVSYQNEKPVPFYVSKPRSQSLDEKYQQNRMLCEWLEFILLKGRVKSDFLP